MDSQCQCMQTASVREFTEGDLHVLPVVDHIFHSINGEPFNTMDTFDSVQDAGLELDTLFSDYEDLMHMMPHKDVAQKTDAFRSNDTEDNLGKTELSLGAYMKTRYWLNDSCSLLSVSGEGSQVTAKRGGDDKVLVQESENNPDDAEGKSPAASVLLSADEEFKDYLSEVRNNREPFKSGTTCKLCPNRVFARRHDLVLHIQTMHLNERRFTCRYDTCDAKFKRKSHLKSHISAVHEKSESFICQYCFKCYTSDSTRRKHIRNLHKTMQY